jgi:hypothetical protein
MTTKPHVIFYTRPGCHLCDEARREMARSGCDGRYTLEEVNVDDDPTLKARYGWDIPVLLIDSVVAFKHHLTAEEFRREINLHTERQYRDR